MATNSISYRARFTRNMGNFESLQLEVGVEFEPHGDETPSQTYNRAKNFVESRLLEEVESLENSIRSARGE